MKLDCLRDICPLTRQPVDMRTCCNGWGLDRVGNKRASGVQPCAFYGREPWSELGKVTCDNPDSKPASTMEREENRTIFKKLAPGLGHQLYCHWQKKKS